MITNFYQRVIVASCVFMLSLWVFPTASFAQYKVEEIKFGDMDQWVDRQVKESKIIGGDVKHVYAVGPEQVLATREPYVNLGGSPWGTSNVMAKVAGVVKTNTSVVPEKRGNGYCARLDTRMESVKVFGLIDITVLAAGSMFLGSVNEPIRGTKDPYKHLNMGIPFTKRPAALQFDYKIRMADRPNRIRATGFSKIVDVEGKDEPVVTLLLQKRWEDEEGNIYAKRVGTMVMRYDHSTDWNNDAVYKIMYGDITEDAHYKPLLMRLQMEDFYTKNKYGKSTLIHEVDWADKDEVPTHMILSFTSSHGGAYIGSPGNSMWVDNVRLLY